MTSPSSGNQSSPSRLLTIGILGTAWLCLFAVYFFSQTLWANGLQIPRLSVLFDLPELLAANFEPSPKAGWRNLGQRFDLLGVAGLIVGGSWGLGQVVLSRMRLVGDLSWSESIAFATGVGLSLWSLITLLLGLCGVMTGWVFGMILLLAVAGGIAVQIRSRSATPLATKPAKVKASTASQRPARNWLPIAVVAAGTPFVLAMVLGSLLPTTDFDVKEYHLEGPKEYLLQGRITLLPHNVYTSFPFLTEMLTLSAMIVRGDWLRGALAGQAVLMVYALVASLAVFATTRRLCSERAAWLAVLIWLSTPWAYRISVIAYTEGALAAYLVLTFLACCRLAERPQHRGWLCLTGFLAGSAAACKYPGALSAVIPFGLAVLWLNRHIAPPSNHPADVDTASPSPLRAVVTSGAIYSLGVLLAFGPWLLKNLAETGNPVYPLLWSLFGGESFDAATNERWKAAHAAPTYLWSQPSLLLPDLWQRLKEIALTTDWQSPLIAGLAPLSVLVWRRVGLLKWLWLYIVWLFLTWCWLTHRIDRFWVPMLPLLSILAGIGLVSLWSLLTSPQSVTAIEDDSSPPLRIGGLLSQGLLAGGVALCVLFNLAFITTSLAGFNGFLLDETAAREMALGRTIQLCRKAGLPQGGKVLFVGEAAVFEADFDYAYNTVFDDSWFELWFAAPETDRPKSEWSLRPVDEIRQKLAAEGITHICVHWLEVVRYRLPGSYGFTDFVHPRRFEELIQAGLLERTPHLWQPDWNQIGGPERAEIERWAPELIQSTPQGPGLRTIEIFRVVP